MTEAETSKKDGRIVLIALLSFFAIFASVDAYFVYKAITTHAGVVVENAYEIGLNYNDILQEAEKREHER